MKKIILPIVLLLVVVAGCESSQLDDPDRVPDNGYSNFGFWAATARFEAEDTKTLLGPELEVLWSEGDAVTIFSQDKINHKYVLEQGAGTIRGVFLPASYLDGVKNQGVPDFIAVYPYSPDLALALHQNLYAVTGLVLPAEQMYQEASFAGAAFPMLAVSQDQTLAFKNLCGVLRLNFTGTAKVRRISVRGNAGEGLAGPFRLIADAAGPQKLEMQPGAAATVVLDCGEGVMLGPEPTAFHLSLPPLVLSNGFTVTVEDVDGNTALFRTAAPHEILKNTILDMPVREVVPDLPAVDLSAGGTANAYIVSGPGRYRFRADVKGNGHPDEILGSTEPWLVGMSRAETLWESFGSDQPVTAGELVTEVRYKSGYVCFTVPSPMKTGNAVVAVRDKEGKILWSWHLWLLDEPVEVHVHANGFGTMMDRNLGALSALPGEVSAFGLLYQWGRKDPFLGSAALKEVRPVLSTGVWPEPVLSDHLTGTVAYVTAHPMTLVAPVEGPDSNNDWYFTGFQGSDYHRWHPEKSIYDPCPPGWRVPDIRVWTGVEAHGAAFDPVKAGALYPADFSGTEAWYPACGYLAPGKSFLGVGQIGTCWSLDTYDSKAKPALMLYLEDRYSYADEYAGRAEAHSVRCQKM